MLHSSGHNGINNATFQLLFMGWARPPPQIYVVSWDVQLSESENVLNAELCSLYDRGWVEQRTIVNGPAAIGKAFR